MTEAFSAVTRAADWASLTGQVFDLVVIGGGITGCGVARDAAGRGLKVALFEAGDLAGGTSGRSSRLVHGGLRYLETLEFDLVFEALRERRRLLELAPHLVRPVPFLFPVYRGDPTGLLKLAAGMWLYEGLSLFRSPQRHRMLGVSGVRDREPGLRTDGLSGAAVYHDAQVDDARLTLAVARAAQESGALIVPRARVVELRVAPKGESDVLVEDDLRGDEARVAARLVVNATGPWADRVRALADPQARPRLRTTKGVHVLVPRDRIPHRHAIIFLSAVDRRVMFVLPWNDYTYIGTTDTEFSGDPAAAAAEPQDVQYLLDSANALFAGARLRPSDVLSTWTGVRPLLAPAGERELSASATSREHDIWRDASGLLTVAGGKLTTYRSMAAETVDEVARILLSEHAVQSGRCYTEYLPLPGAPETEWPEFMEDLRQRVSASALPPGMADHLAFRYGSDALRLLEMIEEERELARPVHPDHPYLLAEVLYASRHEMALTLEDVMRRRLHLFYEAADGGAGVAREVVRLMAREPGLVWDDARVERELSDYQEAVRRTRPPA